MTVAKMRGRNACPRLPANASEHERRLRAAGRCRWNRNEGPRLRALRGGLGKGDPLNSTLGNSVTST